MEKSVAGVVNKKVVVLGDANAGKTSILKRFVDGVFAMEQVTIGVSLYCKEMKVGNGIVKLSLWDTYGLEEKKSIPLMYLKDIDGIVLVYATCRKSLEMIFAFWKEIIEEGLKRNKIPIILIGNKNDLRGKVISIKEGEIKAKENGMEYIETSARTGWNITQLFTQLTEMMVSNN